VEKPSSTRSSIIGGGAKFPSKRTKMLVVSIVFVIAVVSAWFIRDSVLYERTDDAQIDGNIMPLSARINGQVQQVNVIDGQLVHAGDVLAILDQQEYSIAVYHAMATLAYAENIAASLYFNAAITVTTAYGGLRSAQAAVKDAQAEVAAAEHKLQSDESLLKQVQTSQAQLELIEVTVAADQETLLQTEAKLRQSVSDLRNAQTAPERASLAKVTAQAADSQVLQCRAQLEQAQLKLSNTIIRSPVTGIVGRRRIEVGQNVAIGQDVIDVISLDDVWITANFKESQLVHLRPGQPVEIKVEAYGRTWQGHVTNLGGASSVFSGIVLNTNHVPRVTVRIDFDRPEREGFNAADLLKPGLSAEPKVMRWLPRTSKPNISPDGQGSAVEPRAWWHRLPLTAAWTCPRQLHGIAPLLWSLGR
jgi:membrane fusion protein, multidrug efflux system